MSFLSRTASDQSSGFSNQQALLVLLLVFPVGLVVLGLGFTVLMRPQAQQAEQPKATTELRGSVSYPSDWIPKMAICSLEITNRSETCEEFPASKRNYEYTLSLDAPGEYWVYWSPQEGALNGQKFWIGRCPPDRSGACSEFRVTKFQTHPKITSIPNIDIGTLNPRAPLIFE